jgi:prevent-host-death family protein
MFTFPKTTTGKQLQQNYRQIFDLVKKTKEPVIVMRNNQPDVAIVDVKKLEELGAIADVLISREETEKGKAKVLKSLTDLWHETQYD